MMHFGWEHSIFYVVITVLFRYARWAMSFTAYIGLATVFTVLILANVLGNTLVIIVVFTRRSMRTPMNFLLVNLAVADMLAGIFIGVLVVTNPTYQHPTGTTGQYLCKFITGGTVAYTAAVASVYNLVAVSVERYFAVLYPLREARLTPRNLRLIIVGIWCLSLLWVMPLFYMWPIESTFRPAANSGPILCYQRYTALVGISRQHLCRCLSWPSCILRFVIIPLLQLTCSVPL